MKHDESYTVGGPHTGHLVIVGGNENRNSDMVIELDGLAR